VKKGNSSKKKESLIEFLPEEARERLKQTEEEVEVKRGYIKDYVTGNSVK
jgi:hypothetical protein